MGSGPVFVQPLPGSVRELTPEITWRILDYLIRRTGGAGLSDGVHENALGVAQNDAATGELLAMGEEQARELSSIRAQLGASSTQDIEDEIARIRSEVEAVRGAASGIETALGDRLEAIERQLSLLSAALAAQIGTDAASDIETLDANKQPRDSTLTALAGYNTAGLLVQTAPDAFAGRALTAPTAGLTITNPAGEAGDPTFALANDLAAIEALSGTNIFPVRTAADAWAELAYVSGLFAPTVALSTPGTSSFTYATQTGRYVRVGAFVIAEIVLNFTPTIGTGSGPLLIETLPVAAAATAGAVGSAITSASFAWPAGTTNMTVRPNTTTTLRLTATGSATAAVEIGAAHLTGGAAHFVNLTLLYVAA